MRKMTLFTAFLALAFAGAAPAAAQRAAAAPSPLTVTVENRTAQAEKARGGARTDEHARPGDVLRYRLSFRNPGTGNVRGVKLANPVAAGMRFVGGSATSSRTDARLEFSADGGRTFSAQPMEEVADEQGRTVRRPVPSERYTHVRWTIDGSVAPGATVTAEFDARVNAGSETPSAPRGR